MSKIFRPADILLPVNCDMTKWSVVACDQFSSEPEYWDGLDRFVADAPSALRLMLPEAYLETRDQFAEAEKINEKMREYLDSGVFETLEQSYIYVERTLADGKVRRGVVGVLDLDAYDYSKNSASPIRATEGTVENRLPPRVRVRRGASLEMPHIMVFIDDEKNTVMQPLTDGREELRKVYDFDLCCGGGHIRGWQVTGAAAQALDGAIDALSDTKALRAKYGDKAPAVFAMGDGNHSLATAKKCWEEIKPTLTPEQAENHPARFGMVELVNIHDDAIGFEPIHKVLFETSPDGFADAAESFWREHDRGGEHCHELRIVTAQEERTVRVGGLAIGELIGLAEEFCQSWMQTHGGRIDYIHNDETALEMGRRAGGAALLLPRMEKGELFPSIITSGPFPKKSFSIGHAQDKRYYLECRRIG